MSKVVSANRLADGIVVFLVEAGQWTPDISRATVFAPADIAAALQTAKADETRNLVVDPFEVEIKDAPASETAPSREAVSLRNAIRAKGPTIDFLPHSEERSVSQRS